MKKSKRFKAIEKTAGIQEVDAALELVKKNATAKFDESIDVSFDLNIMKKHTIRDTVVYPNNFGKSPRIMAFCRGDKAEAARANGADHVGDDDFIQKIADGWLEFDVAIATPDMMKSISKVAKILGTKGMMPNPKAKTVTENIADAVKEIKSGRREFRANEHGVINFPIGKASMEPAQLRDNLKEIFSQVNKKKPTDLKGEYIKSVHLSSTMGKGVEISKKSF